MKENLGIPSANARSRSYRERNECVPIPIPKEAIGIEGVGIRPVLRCKSVLSSNVVPLLFQLTVKVQRARVQIDLCAFRTRNHDSFPVLIFSTQSGVKGALLGYMSHWREHAQGFIENGWNVGESDNIRVRLPDTKILRRRAKDISRIDLPEAPPPVPPRGSPRVPSAVSPDALRALRRQRQERG